MFLLLSKVFAVVLAAIVFAKSYVDFRSRMESLQLFLFWTITWAMIVVVALFPSIVDYILLRSGGQGVGIGTFFGVVLVFLFFIVYRMFVKIERLEHKLTKTIQELALRAEWRGKQ